MQGATPGTVLRNDLMEAHEELKFEDLNLQADKILPPMSVSLKTDVYPVIPREAVAKVPDTKRAPDGSFSRGQWNWGTATYDCEMFGHEEEFDIVHGKENQRWVAEEEVTSALSIHGLLLGREARVASAVLNTNTWTGTNNLHTITNEWDDATTCTPAEDIAAAFLKLRKKNALSKKLYSLIMTDDMLDFCCNSAAVRAAVVYTTPVQIMAPEAKKALATSYLGVKEIILTSALFDTAGLNKDADFAKFWSNEYMLLAKLSSGGASFKEGCLGRQPVFNVFPTTYGIDQYEEPKTMKRIFRAFEYRGIILNTDYGILIDNCKDKVGTDNI